MGSDYGDFCREIKEAKRQARMMHGTPCPICVEKLPKAFPSILLPAQRCKIHNYKDPRKRTSDNEYLTPAPTKDQQGDNQ